MLVTLSGIVMLVRLVQRPNAPLPIEVTPSGIVILFRLVQLEKVAGPILVRPSGISTLVRPLQPTKVPLVEVTPLGIVMLVRLSQRRKAFSPMLVTGLPSMVAGMTSSPVAELLQSVMVTFPPVVVHVRSSKPAAWRGRAAKRKRARNPVRCFMSPVTTTPNQAVEGRVATVVVSGEKVGLVAQVSAAVVAHVPPTSLACSHAHVKYASS